MGVLKPEWKVGGFFTSSLFINSDKNQISMFKNTNQTKQPHFKSMKIKTKLFLPLVQPISFQMLKLKNKEKWLPQRQICVFTKKLEKSRKNKPISELEFFWNLNNSNKNWYKYTYLCDETEIFDHLFSTKERFSEKKRVFASSSESSSSFHTLSFC